MKTFKLIEDDRGVIEQVLFNSGELFNTIDELVEWTEENEDKIYGENLHHLTVVLEGRDFNYRLLSSLKNGLTARIKLNRTTFVDVKAWKLNIGADEESLRKVESMKSENGYISSSPAVEVNNSFFKAMGYNEASERVKWAPNLLDGWLSSSKYPSVGFKPAYSGGILASPADPNKVYDNVSSYDITSAYPYSALTTMVPMGESYMLSKEDIKQLNITQGKINIDKEYGFIGLFKITQAKRKDWVRAPFLKRDDREFLKNGEIDKMGIVSGDMMLAMDPHDLEILCLQYDYKEIEIIEMSIHKLGKIPNKAAYFIKNAYKKKNNKPSGSPEKEEAKTALNTIVGFWGTDPFHTMKKSVLEDGIVVNVYDGDLHEHFSNYTGNGSKMGRAAGKARTWDFRWAVYSVSANRLRIAQAEKKIYDEGLELLYIDTDSIKVSGDKEKVKKIFKELNEQVISTLDYEGLGLWKDESEEYDKAVFRGVKVYFYDNDKGTRKNVVSGVESNDALAFTNITLEQLADTDYKIEVFIKRRDVGKLKKDPFGATTVYSIRTIKVSY